jgi:hypothetical protein
MKNYTEQLKKTLKDVLEWIDVGTLDAPLSPAPGFDRSHADSLLAMNWESFSDCGVLPNGLTWFEEREGVLCDKLRADIDEGKTGAQWVGGAFKPSCGDYLAGRGDKLQEDIDEVREGLQYGEEVYCHAFERVVSALESAVQWQPIEEAPKETPITVFYNGEIYHNVLLAIGGFLGWFRKSEFGADVPLDEDFAPTHWMRIKPPKV